MNGVFSNPELIRNARAQLRPGRMVVIAMICAVLSLVVGYSMAQESTTRAAEMQWGLAFLRLVLGAQIAALALGGAAACGQSILREKLTNTFDFQRVTRLTPWELVVGKLTGAAVIPWFIVACLMPAALWGAVVARVSPLYLLAVYVVMIVGSLTLQAAALLLSLANARDAGSRILSALVIIPLIFSVIGLEGASQSSLAGGKFTPFFALALVESSAWDTSQHAHCMQVTNNVYACSGGMVDVFFGQAVNHLLIYLLVNLIFTAWFLLGVTRNIKRDPSVYEVFTPAQSLGFALYLNLLLLGFFHWHELTPPDGQNAANSIEIALFFLLGMVLLRNRDQVRRRLRQLGHRASGWIEAAWPAPYVLGGMLTAGLAVIETIELSTSDKRVWPRWWELAIFRLVFLALWLVRDILYIQWMGLRRGRHSRVLGFVYWSVYYTALTILFASLHIFNTPASLPFTAIFMPWPVIALDANSWTAAREAWILALVMQAVVAGLFVVMQRRRLLELSVAAAPSTAPLAAGD